MVFLLSNMTSASICVFCRNVIVTPLKYLEAACSCDRVSSNVDINFPLHGLLVELQHKNIQKSASQHMQNQ